MIVKYFDKYEFDWERMAVHFPRRSPIMLKNRYYAHIRKKDLIDELRAGLAEAERTGDIIENQYQAELEAADRLENQEPDEETKAEMEIPIVSRTSNKVPKSSKKKNSSPMK
mmetsp:Transcript_99174/g.137764  ORF Transcript_99174/g.137764 Transcript_99174/m.137764 type:complete len:112 (-) Transcript_99174:671-1006(-)